MFRLFNNLFLYQTEDAGGTGGAVTADSILEALNESAENRDDEEGTEGNLEDTKKGDKEKEPDTKDTEKEDEETEEDELKALEEELKEPTDEDLELKTPVQRRQLMKDYPDIFKKHPGLESTIYRERAYTDLLPTIQDAKEALDAVKTLDSFDADLRQGNTIKMMKAVASEDPQGFARIADNYMHNLAQVDERAYHHVLGNITKDIVETMIKFGREKEDIAIQDAATTLYQFMFNTTKWEGKKRLAASSVSAKSSDPNVADERTAFEKEKQEFEEGKSKEHTGKLMTSIDNQIKGTIEKTIDPKGVMGDFVKSKAIDEVLSKASKLLKMDTRFQAIVKQLNDKAGKEKYSDESLNRIKSAYFTKYKAILLPIVKAVRSEALKGTRSRIKKDEETNDTTERANRDKPQSRDKSGNNTDRSKPLPGESSVDFLLRRNK